MSIIIPHFIRQPKYVCRACPARFYEGEEREYAVHTRRCADDYMERVRAREADFKDLECRDPEYRDWSARAYRQGKLRPSDKPV